MTIYLDYHASTPCDPSVVEAMLPYFLERFANPSSTVHKAGQRTANAVSAARQTVGDAIGALPAEIVFTAGATESNNLALQGLARAAPSDRRRIVSSVIEHKSVLQTLMFLQPQGFDVVLVPVDGEGSIDLAALVDAVDDTTAFVSVQAASNEIGTIQPLEEISQIAHRSGAAFHSDAAQAMGRIPIDVGAWGVDLMSLSGHKCYGPKGVGCLYVRGGVRAAPMDPLLFGGGQEGGLRPGTHNVPGIVGLAKAVEIATESRETETERIGVLRDRFEQLIAEQFPAVRRNGCVRRRLAGNSSLTFSGVDAEALIANLSDIAVSTGSACSSGAIDPSHVLTAIGLSREEAHETIRVGLGRFTMEGEVLTAAAGIAEAAKSVLQASCPETAGAG